MNYVDIFPLDEEMLLYSLNQSILGLDLKPFDQAILSAILVRSQQLRTDDATPHVFCELDLDLCPFDKDGNAKIAIQGLYDSARIWVYRSWDFDESEIPREWYRTDL